MKIHTLFLFGVLLSAYHAQAASYTCADKNGDVMKVTIDAQKMSIKDQVDALGSGKTGTIVFLNNGLNGGNGKYASTIATFGLNKLQKSTQVSKNITYSPL